VTELPRARDEFLSLCFSTFRHRHFVEKDTVDSVETEAAKAKPKLPGKQSNPVEYCGINPFPDGFGAYCLGDPILFATFENREIVHRE